MRLLKDKTFYVFLLPSLVGMFLFITPIQYNGNLTIPIAVAANVMLDFMGKYTRTIIWVLISASAIMTIVHKVLKISWIKKDPKLDHLFDVKGFWLIVRMLGFLFVNMIYSFICDIHIKI